MLMRDLVEAGMAPIGRFQDGAFQIEPEWRKRIAVYAWFDRDRLRIIRVGIACAKTGLQARYSSYNRWLAGRFKPHDEREQKVSSLFRERLGENIEVWAVEISDKRAALTLEKALRAKWREGLDLDLMVRSSWVKQQMNAWRGLR